MNMRRSEIAVFGIVLLSLLASICCYPHIPEEVDTHWNTQGQVDGRTPKFWALFSMPLILAGVSLLFFVIPRIDPLKANIEKFRKYYDGFIILFLLFMLSVHCQVILWNFGIKVGPNVVIPIGFGVLVFYIGILCEHAKRNWFIGIRTPWTLSSERVWNKTHKVGGKLFRVGGVIIFVSVFFQKYMLFFILIPALSIAVYTLVYSYLEYQKEVKGGVRGDSTS